MQTVLEKKKLNISQEFQLGCKYILSKDTFAADVTVRCSVLQSTCTAMSCSQSLVKTVDTVKRYQSEAVTNLACSYCSHIIRTCKLKSMVSVGLILLTMLPSDTVLQFQFCAQSLWFSRVQQTIKRSPYCRKADYKAAFLTFQSSVVIAFLLCSVSSVQGISM